MPAKVIGQSVPRTGAVERVTGAWKFTADMGAPDMLHVKLVRIDAGHARILEIDTEAARALPGVRCVLTGADLGNPVPRYGPVFRDCPVLADGEVKFYGEPVAAVAADDPDTAARAAALIKVKFEELPGLYTIDDALAPGAPLVQDPAIRPESPWRETNLLGEWKFEWGDLEQANSEAALVLEDTYNFPMITHFAIEPHAFVAAPDGDGIVVWSAVQHPFALRKALGLVLGLPVSKIRVVVPDIGGGFGGKGYVKMEPLVAIMALRTGRPVRLVFDLHESFLAGRRASCRVRMRTGFDAQGRLVFNDMVADYQVGAYGDVATRVVSKASYLGTGPYYAPTSRFIGRGVMSHTVPSTAFRGFGAPQIIWAVESQMDEAARRLGIDGLEIRLRNIPPRGTTLIPGDTPVDGDWAAGLRKAAELVGWDTPLPPGRGRGVAIGIKSPAPATVSQSVVRMHHDGSVTVHCGTTDMGQGARTAFRQIAAQVLGVPLESVATILSDTSAVPWDQMTASSRSTVCMGNAVVAACHDLLDQLKKMAVECFGYSPDEVSVSGGRVEVPGRSHSYLEVSSTYYGVEGQGEIVGTGTFQAPTDRKHPLGGNALFWEIIFTAVEAEVDQETGHVTLAKMASVGDIGTAINPAQVEGQDEGGAVMGLGHSLMEHLIHDQRGRMLNSGALDYRIPTIKDVAPEVKSALIQNGDGPGPFGAKGTGESGIIAIAPAIGAAVTQATGVRIRDLPLTPERVWREMAAHK